MSGTIIQPENKQVISDLKNERDTFQRALKDIVDAKGQKSRKVAIDKAREIIYPTKLEDDSYPFWRGRLDWWNHK